MSLFIHIERAWRHIAQIMHRTPLKLKKIVMHQFKMMHTSIVCKLDVAVDFMKSRECVYLIHSPIHSPPPKKGNKIKMYRLRN